ncbi:hypothetical protein NM688_g1670 [Phlebia brevispora]|uniref:Uncharacterized protein n=1 Tax=Phlebia brevispora TaxID=194682 RepID=A0ACC1TAU9_9APHY|nr:hypothetical protein NM688_g1670 [Phlebia brevispora]
MDDESRTDRAIAGASPTAQVSDKYNMPGGFHLDHGDFSKPLEVQAGKGSSDAIQPMDIDVIGFSSFESDPSTKGKAQSTNKSVSSELTNPGSESRGSQLEWGGFDLVANQGMSSFQGISESSSHSESWRGFDLLGHHDASATPVRTTQPPQLLGYHKTFTHLLVCCVKAGDKS